MCGRRGFSLLEVLTVTAIIGLMISIAVPVVNNATFSIRSVMCRAKLEQLGQCWNLYVIDNDGKFMKRGEGSSYGAVSWFHSIREYYDPNDEPMLCPQATRTPAEGGRNPYMAWEDTTDFGEYYKGSYGLNLWVANGDGGLNSAGPDFERLCWRTPDVRGSSYAPLVLCSQWKDVQPYPSDEPLPYETDVWTPGPMHEMRRPCIKRHPPYSINVLLLDYSVDERTIKELWRLKWHREWPSDEPLPVWPDWMADVPDPDGNGG